MVTQVNDHQGRCESKLHEGSEVAATPAQVHVGLFVAGMSFRSFVDTEHAAPPLQKVDKAVAHLKVDLQSRGPAGPIWTRWDGPRRSDERSNVSTRQGVR